MEELIFIPNYNDKYRTTSIEIEKAHISIEEEDFEIKETKIKYNKLVGTIKIKNQDIIDKLKTWETKINDYLENEGWNGKITVVYDKTIYPKIKYISALDWIKDCYMLKAESIWCNTENKPFIQLKFVHFKSQ